MLGIEWLNTNEAKWNFLDGTIEIRSPESNIGRVNPLPTQPGQELAVRSIHTQRDDCMRLTTDSVVLPYFSCAISKEVLFQVLDKLCETDKTNVFIKQLLNDFVAKLIAGKYSIKSKVDPPDYTSEQGDFLEIILLHDRITKYPENIPRRPAKIQEHSDSNSQSCEIDGYNLPTLFGENADLTNFEFDVDDFKYSDLFYENGEVYADTLWSTVDH